MELLAVGEIEEIAFHSRSDWCHDVSSSKGEMMGLADGSAGVAPGRGTRGMEMVTGVQMGKYANGLV